MTIGDRIKKQRTLLGISQTELAEKVNISKQRLYKYETNIVTNIPSNKIEEIAKALNVSPAYLMGWDDEDYEQTINDKIADAEYEQFITEYSWNNDPHNPNYINPSTIDFKEIYTPKDLQDLIDSSGKTAESILGLRELTYEEIESKYISKLLEKEGYTRIFTNIGNDKEIFILENNDVYYIIDFADYYTLISSLKDYFSFNLKNLILNAPKKFYSSIKALEELNRKPTDKPE